MYSHSHIVEKSFGLNFPDSLNNTILGFYSYSDQKLWDNGSRNLSVFTQVGYSPGKCTNSFYLGVGMNYTGLWSRHGKDIAGIAVASEHFRGGWKSETAIEFTYRYQINNHFFVQPDIQYIFHPAGTGEILNNSFAGNFRFGLNF
jgi:porin